MQINKHKVSVSMLYNSANTLPRIWHFHHSPYRFYSYHVMPKHTNQPNDPNTRMFLESQPYDI